MDEGVERETGIQRLRRGGPGDRPELGQAGGGVGCVILGKGRKAAGAEDGTALGEWRGEEALLLLLLLLLEREDGAGWWVVSSSEERYEYLGLLLSAQKDPEGELRRGTRVRVRSLRASSGAVVTRHQGARTTACHFEALHTQLAL